jgi:hypothetical protein
MSGTTKQVQMSKCTRIDTLPITLKRRKQADKTSILYCPFQLKVMQLRRSKHMRVHSMGINLEKRGSILINDEIHYAFARRAQK